MSKSPYPPADNTHGSPADDVPSMTCSPDTLHPHPYDRVAYQHPYDTLLRPSIFGAHTLLCSVKVSDTLIADRPPPRVDEYPIGQILPVYGLSSILNDEEGAQEALALANTAHLAIQAQGGTIQAKIQEELMILKILKRREEKVASAALAADKQVEEITGRPHNPSGSTGWLSSEEEAQWAVELGKAAVLVVRTQETMLRTKIVEELVVLRILQRKAESIDSAARDSERQIGELTRMLNDWMSYQKRVGEPMDDRVYSDSDDEDCDLEKITPLDPLSDEGGTE